jgi:hypothetical protein
MSLPAQERTRPPLRWVHKQYFLNNLQYLISSVIKMPCPGLQLFTPSCCFTLHKETYLSKIYLHILRRHYYALLQKPKDPHCYRISTSPVRILLLSPPEGRQLHSERAQLWPHKSTFFLTEEHIKNPYTASKLKLYNEFNQNRNYETYNKRSLIAKYA